MTALGILCTFHLAPSLAARLEYFEPSLLGESVESNPSIQQQDVAGSFGSRDMQGCCMASMFEGSCRHHGMYSSVHCGDIPKKTERRLDLQSEEGGEEDEPLNVCISKWVWGLRGCWGCV